MMQVNKQNIADVIDDLEELIDEVPKERKDFAESLINGEYGFRKRGFLTEKQMWWAGQLLGMAITGKNEIRKSEPKMVKTPDLSGLMEMFAHAKKHLKYPKIVLEYENETFKMSVAGPNSQKPGWVNLTDGGPYGANQWYGRISPEGDWQLPKQIDEGTYKRLCRLLKAFSDDAAAAAAKYGKMTGNCCFCNSGLTDEKSTSVGYGPVCAKHYGLPWGNKA